MQRAFPASNAFKECQGRIRGAMTHPVARINIGGTTGGILRGRCITAFPEPDTDVGVCAFNGIPGFSETVY